MPYVQEYLEPEQKLSSPSQFHRKQTVIQV